MKHFKRILLLLCLQIIVIGALAQTFRLEVSAFNPSADTCRIQVTRISEQSVTKNVIYNDIIGNESVESLGIDIHYLRGEAIFIELWSNSQYRGGIQFYPNQFNRKQKKVLSIILFSELIYNFK